MSDVPQRWVEMAMDAIGPESDFDTLDQAVEETLRPVLADLRYQVFGLWLTSDTDQTYIDGYECAKRDMLDLLSTGGSDE